MADRKTVSKRLRFEIFKRDGFRCTYCGATPVAAVLRVDHVIPVVEGGTNDPSNLVTACDSCNAGKGPIPLDRKKHGAGMVTDENRDHAEQIREWLALQREVSAAKGEVTAALVDAWQQNVGHVPQDLRSKAPGLLKEFSLAQLCEAVSIVGSKGLRGAVDQMRYFHGILRKWRHPVPPVLQQADSDSQAVQRLYLWQEALHTSGLGSPENVVEMFVRASGSPALLTYWDEPTPQDAAVRLARLFTEQLVDGTPWSSIDGQTAYVMWSPCDDLVFGAKAMSVAEVEKECLYQLADPLPPGGRMWRRLAWVEGLLSFAGWEPSALADFSGRLQSWAATDAEHQEIAEFRGQLQHFWLRDGSDLERWMATKEAA